MADVDEYPPVDIPNLKLVDVVSIHESVVKLNFYKDGKPAVGTGFFINIPDSPYEVILTAGHNLYTKMKTFTTQVTICLPHPNRLSAEPYTIGPIPAEHIKLSAEYLKDPNLAEADYGVILIPYTGKGDRRGLGFKMMHAFTELRGEATVSGYRQETLPGRPVMSTGVILTNESTEDRLVYEAPTEQGISGSPVWITYKIGETAVVAVVAVHNHGTATGFKGSRGSRLSPKLLREVFAWASLDTTKKIRAQNIGRDPTPPPPSGLYMIFGEKPFARLQLETGTDFNVFPGQVTSSGVEYVLELGDKWVMFDAENQEAVLVDRPREQSLFRKKKTTKHPHIVFIVIGNKYQLRMDGSMFKSHDLPGTQRSGLSIVTGSKSPFIHFTFEPYKPFTPLATAVGDPQDDTLCPTCGNKLSHKA